MKCSTCGVEKMLTEFEAVEGGLKRCPCGQWNPITTDARIRYLARRVYKLEEAITKVTRKHAWSYSDYVRREFWGARDGEDRK